MKEDKEIIDEDVNIKPVKIPGKKLLCGLIVFIVAILSPLLIPIIIQLNISLP